MASNVDQIYESMKREIINLDLIPGSKIKEEDLAVKYQTSRTPIRSVIARLVKDSLLVVVPQKGTYVSKISMNNIMDYVYVRKAVELSVIKKVSEVITDEQLTELEEILKQQKEIIMMEPSIAKSKMFFHNDNRFHASLFRFVGLEGVWTLIHTNATPLNRARIMANLRNTADVEKVYNQHYAVYEYLKNHDFDNAIKAFDEHLDKGFEGIGIVKEKYKDFFIEGE